MEPLQRDGRATFPQVGDLWHSASECGVKGSFGDSKVLPSWNLILGTPTPKLGPLEPRGQGGGGPSYLVRVRVRLFFPEIHNFHRAIRRFILVKGLMATHLDSFLATACDYNAWKSMEHLMMLWAFPLELEPLQFIAILAKPIAVIHMKDQTSIVFTGHSRLPLMQIFFIFVWPFREKLNHFHPHQMYNCVSPLGV